MSKKNLLLIITGSVATIRFIKLSRQLEEAGFRVRVVVTSKAWWLVLSVILRNPKNLIYFMKHWQPAFVELIDSIRVKRGSVKHINLTKWANLILVAPITANTLAKITSGMTDSFPLCLIRALPPNKKVFLAPAMNTSMWQDPAIVKSIELLSSQLFNKKYIIIPPIYKKLFCGDRGNGAMAEVETIVEKIKNQ